jgi:hypothetical protein
MILAIFNVFLWGGELLIRAGKVAISALCCCVEEEVCPFCCSTTPQSITVTFSGVAAKAPEECDSCTSWNTSWNVPIETGCQWCVEHTDAAQCNNKNASVPCTGSIVANISEPTTNNFRLNVTVYEDDIITAVFRTSTQEDCFICSGTYSSIPRTTTNNADCSWSSGTCSVTF